MPSLRKLLTLTARSSDADVYKVYGVPKAIRQFNPIKNLRERIPIDIASRTKKKPGQFIKLDLYVHYITDTQKDPLPKELQSTIKELQSMDVFPTPCPSEHQMCINYRKNIANYKKQLRRIKKSGRKTHFKLLSTAEIKKWLTSPAFQTILNEMSELSTNTVKLRVTPKSIKSIQRVASAVQKQYTHNMLYDGPLFRLRCVCKVIAATKSAKEDTAGNIAHSFDTWEWRLKHSIGRRLSNDLQLPYRGDFDIVAARPHLGGPPIIDIGPHFIKLWVK